MKHIRDFKQLLNEKSENLIYTLKTNEYDSKIIPSLVYLSQGFSTELFDK